MSPRRSVDQFQDILLPLCQGRVEVRAGAGQGIMANAVDNKAIRPGDATAFLHIVPNERRVVHIVLDEDRAKIDVPGTA